jgi:hypothetical protein
MFTGLDMMLCLPYIASMMINTLERVPMPHREKVAWLSLAAMAVTFIPYFGFMAISPPAAKLPDMRSLGLLAATLVAQSLILGAGHLWLRIRSPEESRLPADERDRAISRRSLGVAYYFLIAGFTLVGCVLPFTSGGWTIVNAAVGAIVTAEVVHYGVAVWSYRQGWHD